MEESMKFIYKNISHTTQSLIGVGEVKPGETIEVETLIENPNFELVKEPTKVVKK
jgi:hypothetical protein